MRLFFENYFTFSFTFWVGYLRLLSGDMTNLSHVKEQQKNIFYDASSLTPWTNTDTIRRYNLMFPFYPFRTLAPKELFSYQKQQSEYNLSVPAIVPAHTQMNLTFKRREIRNFLNYLLPEDLNQIAGGIKDRLTADERTIATSFEVAGQPKRTATEAAPERVIYSIESAEIKLIDVYLQVNNDKR